MSDPISGVNVAGWTGNGLGKFPDGTQTGVQADPIRAEGMLFFKGWLVMLMSVYTRVRHRCAYEGGDVRRGCALWLP